MRHWSLWLALVVAAAPGAGHQTDLRADLVKAQETWQARKPASYEFTIEVRCFCLGIVRPPPTFRVVAGESSSVATLGKDSRNLYGSFDTVEKLFAAIERSLTRGQYKSAVQYDETFGFPVRADLDPQRYVKDEELYLRVSDFRVIEKQHAQRRSAMWGPAAYGAVFGAAAPLLLRAAPQPAGSTCSSLRGR